ncbi:hypothetical protein [Pseudomonas piscis]|uniref:hypothetical protein n=1 Tax=Pseudomonas piscis TaxID=2614538 RepID=UPI0021D5CE5E|nr:hypothetical protein [Pseudomonas piscis]MCU7649733.1 hypothetical protein [Pseudomonas piscis]
MMWKPVGVGVLIGLFIAIQLAIFFFAFFPASTRLVDQALVSYTKDVIGPIVTGLGGAMLGASAAFYFQKISEAAKNYNDSVRVLRLVKLQLIQRLGELTSIKKYSVLPHEDKKCRFMDVGPLPESPGVKSQVDSKILDLLASERAGKAIEDIMLGEQRYFACFENFKERNKALYDYRDKMKASGLADKLHYDFDKVIEALEPGRITSLYINTEEMLSILDDSIKTIESALIGVGEALDSKYTIKGTVNFTLTKAEPHLFEALKPPYFTLDSLESRILRVHQARKL